MNLAERLLDPEKFEAALAEVESENGLLDTVRIYRDAIVELHRRLEAAKADLAAAREEIARLKNAVRGFRCTCYCNVHGPGCGAQESTCRGIVRCDRCAAIDAARAGGGR